MSIFNALKTQAERLLTKMEHGKSYSIRDVHTRVKQAAQIMPGDPVVRTFAGIIDKMANTSPDRVITQGELHSLYQDLLGLNNNTQFREALGDLIFDAPQSVSTTNHEYLDSIRDPGGKPLDMTVEGFDELKDIFVHDSNHYTPQNAKQAQQKVEKELLTLGFNNSSVRLLGGDSTNLVFSAQLDTPRGTTSIYIPVPSDGQSFPKAFVGENKFAAPLTSANLYKYISSKLESDRLIPNKQSFLEPQKPEISKEFRPLIEQMEEQVVEASLDYPVESVKQAKEIIIRELDSMGFHHAQLKVSASTQDGFICEAILNSPQGKMSIEIPVEMYNNKPLLPSIFAKGDYVADFNQDNLHALMYKEAGRIDGAIAPDSQLYAMSFQELIGTLKKCAMEGNYDVCDDTLEVIADRFDQDIYCKVVADYQKLLSLARTAEQNMKLAQDDGQFVKTPNSIYPIHKQLGLPANQLIRDEKGKWHKKSSYIHASNGDLPFGITIGNKILLGD